MMEFRFFFFWLLLLPSSTCEPCALPCSHLILSFFFSLARGFPLCCQTQAADIPFIWHSALHLTEVKSWIDVFLPIFSIYLSAPSLCFQSVRSSLDAEHSKTGIPLYSPFLFLLSQTHFNCRNSKINQLEKKRKPPESARRFSREHPAAAWPRVPTEHLVAWGTALLLTTPLLL